MSSRLPAGSAAALKAAERPLVVSGAGLGAPEVIQAAANVARALKKAGRDARISLVFPEANSLGAALLAAGGLESAARAMAARKGQALVIAEADVFRGMPARSARALLSSAAHVICVDHTRHATADAAEIVFPSCAYAESSGSHGLQRGPRAAVLLRDAPGGARAERMAMAG